MQLVEVGNNFWGKKKKKKTKREKEREDIEYELIDKGEWSNVAM